MIGYAGCWPSLRWPPLVEVRKDPLLRLVGRALRIGILLLGTVLAAGCTLAPERPADAFEAEARHALHRDRVLAFDEWRFSARVVLEWDAQLWSGTLSWREIPGERILDVSGPLGRGGGRLTVQPERALLVMRSGERYRASDPEELVAMLTGQRIPLEGLGFWVRGVAEPDLPGERSLDSEGRLQRVVQSGWTVEYRDHDRQGALEMPRALTMQRSGLVMDLVVLAWRFPGSDAPP